MSRKTPDLKAKAADVSAPTGPRPHVDLAELRYLIIDENRFQRTIIKNSLMTFGARTAIEAEDALEALRILNDEGIDVVLMDYDLSHMNGAELTRRIRRGDDLPHPEVPIIMISAAADPHVVIEARNAGVHEFLAKPFSPESLYVRIHASVLQPRKFIRAAGYVGPDRRWLDKGAPAGKDRRGK